MAINNEKNGANRCPKCGATDVSLDVTSGKLKCNFCRTLFDDKSANALGGVEDLVGDVIGDGAGDIVPDENVILTLKCPACGANVVINADEATSAKCHWCRHVLSINEKIQNGAVPDLVLPFKTDKKAAEEKIRDFVKKRKFFAHPKFKAEFSPDTVLGAYLPYMIVDVNSSADMTGEAEHLVRTYTVGSGKDETRYYDADAYDVHREFDLLVDDLTVEASMDKLNQNVLVNTTNVINAIMPFDTENAVNWNPSYLRGYASEKRDTDIKDLKPIVEAQVGDIARFRAKDSMSFYDRGAKWTSEKISVKGTKWKSAYLPVWLYSYLQTSGDKKTLHYVAVNARTGETMGSVPVNKTLLLIISGIIEIFGILLGWYWIRFWIGVDTDDDNPWLLGTVGFTPGFIFYWVQMARYRNMNKRHLHEKDTHSEVRNLKQSDALKEHRKRLRNSRISGENDSSIKGTIAQNGKKMMGEKMANYLGIGRMFGTDPTMAATEQEKKKKKNTGAIIVIVIIVMFFLIVMIGSAISEMSSTRYTENMDGWDDWGYDGSYSFGGGNSYSITGSNLVYLESSIMTSDLGYESSNKLDLIYIYNSKADKAEGWNLEDYDYKYEGIIEDLEVSDSGDFHTKEAEETNDFLKKYGFVSDNSFIEEVDGGKIYYTTYGYSTKDLYCGLSEYVGDDEGSALDLTCVEISEEELEASRNDNNSSNAEKSPSNEESRT